MGFPYQARQKSTWTWLAVSLVSEVSLDCGWAPLPRCQLKRPSVRLIWAGGGPARLLIKVMSCKIEREGGWWQPAPACYTEFHHVCSEMNLPALPVFCCHCKWVCLCRQAWDCCAVETVRVHYLSFALIILSIHHSKWAYGVWLHSLLWFEPFLFSLVNKRNCKCTQT